MERWPGCLACTRRRWAIDVIEKIVSFISTGYGALVALFAAAGVIWGGIKTFQEIRKWISGLLQRYRERRSVPERTLAMVQRIQEEQAQKDVQQRQWMDEVSGRLDKFEGLFDSVKESIVGVDSQVGTLQLEKMMWAYVHYGIELHEISIATRTSLELMYHQYRDKGGHNHVPEDFVEVIRRAPLKEAGD